MWLILTSCFQDKQLTNIISATANSWLKSAAFKASIRSRYFDNQITAFEDAKVVGGGGGEGKKNKNNKK